MPKEYPLCEYARYDKRKGKVTTLVCEKKQGLCMYSRYCGVLFKVVHTPAYQNCALRDKNNKNM